MQKSIAKIYRLSRIKKNLLLSYVEQHSIDIQNELWEIENGI